MRKKWICVFVFLGIAPFELYSQNEYDFSTVDQILSDSVKTISGFGGGCALLLIKDNQVVYDESFGFFYSTDKIVPIASATKWLSAGVIMSLVDDGLISLDDAVSHYLTNFNGEKGTMTIRQMFSHTAGLPTQSSYIGDLSLTLAQAVDSIAHNVDLKVSPGTGFIYGGVSMHVAGRIAKVVRNLGITPNMLYRWIRELNADNQHAFPGLGKLKSLDEELRQLRKKLADTKMERDI